MRMKKIFFAVLAVMLLCIAPAAWAAVEIGLPSGLVAGANLSGTEVYFGSYSGSNILWHVVYDTDSGTRTLWTTTNMGDRAYDTTHSGGTHQDWSGSDICAWLNGTFYDGAFDLAEQGAIATNYGTANEAYGWGTIDSRQKIVLPSVAEIGNGTATGDWGIAYTGGTDGRRGFGAGDEWWLRSPGDGPDLAAYVNSDGHVYDDGPLVISALGVRPALKINLSSVLFTSAASGASAKPPTVSADLTAATTTSGAVKFTVLSSLLTLSSTATVGTVAAGDTVSIPYTGAITGADRYVSCVIVSSGGAVLFYGKLVDCTGGNANGTASFTVPAAADLPDGAYTIKLFNEECNGDNETDFAGTPVDIPMTVNSAPIAPGITGPTTMSLEQGYAATSTGAFSTTGSPSPTVTKTSGDAAITWNNVMQRLDIAAGLAAGTYPIVLTASNGTLPDATATFTLTVNSGTTTGGGGGCDAGVGIFGVLALAATLLTTRKRK
ncbi:MAG: DUF6273 domain-containing protein [Synergistaceae bacterium]|nr:DUF6273 domain-containing protein [Synergistaceae bacterium]